MNADQLLDETAAVLARVVVIAERGKAIQALRASKRGRLGTKSRDAFHKLSTALDELAVALAVVGERDRFRETER